MIICRWNRLLTYRRIASPPQGIYRYSLWCINIYLICVWKGHSLAGFKRLSGWPQPAVWPTEGHQCLEPPPLYRCRPHVGISLFFRGAGKLRQFHAAVNSETFFRNYILWPLGLENHNGFTAAIIRLKKMHVNLCLWREVEELISTPFVVLKKAALLSNSNHKSNVLRKTTSL